jgi:hypothetical protein
MLRWTVRVVMEISRQNERQLDGCLRSDRQSHRPTQQPKRACATGLRAPRPKKHAEQHRPAKQSEGRYWQQNVWKCSIVIGSIEERPEGCDKCGSHSTSRNNQSSDDWVESCPKAGIMQGSPPFRRIPAGSGVGLFLASSAI